MARQRQVSRGTRRAGAAGRGWQGAPHRVGSRVVAAAVTAELSREPRLAKPAMQGEHWEAQRDPGSRLLGISGCLEIRVGQDPGDRVGWGQPPIRLCYKPSTAVERGVYHALPPRSLPGLLGEGDTEVHQEPLPDFRSLRSPCLSFPETGVGVPSRPQRNSLWVPNLEPGEHCVLMLQECGKLWVPGATDKRPELSEFVAFDSIAS